MRKLLSVMLICILILSAVSCGENTKKTDSENNPIQGTPSSEEGQSRAQGGDGSDESQDGEEAGQNQDGNGEGGEGSLDEASGWVPENPVIYEDEYCRYEVVKIYPNKKGSFGYFIKTRGINKKADEIHFGHSVLLNGVEKKGIFSEIVENEKKEEATEVEILTDMDYIKGLRLLGVDDIHHIELAYFVSGSNNGESFYHSGFYDIFPKGEENREKFRRENDADIVLVDNEYVRIVFTDFQYTNQYKSDDLSSMSFRYYAENKTDEPLEIAFYNFFFNNREEMTGDFKRGEILPNRAFYGFVPFASDLMEDEIKAFQNVKFKLVVESENQEYFKGEFELEKGDFKSIINVEDLQ